ncbi:Cyclin-U2-1 [Hondaea fermentalgiana]|uniref:Cyclin-U2-1 n=1 Tax=Hondaea fermentalgiana TaxID=2315210 RepID=A0A2R5GQ21_9STRA|nr:Cyclin-U2-1 [Hondaea fermentalgiana]|eukprot:GBG29984.1 Cyclin-U2-1 [Hondaea fermentalgiana]
MGLGKEAAKLGRRLSRRMAARKERAASAESEDSLVSGVSEIDESQSQCVRESNALNREGLRIVRNVAAELEHRVNMEDRDNEGDAFSSDKIPPISIEGYLCRLARYVNIWRSHAGGRDSAGVRSAVMTVLYLNHLEMTNPEFAINHSNVHRLLMAGMLVATKWTEDGVISTEWWARVAGVSMAEVNKLESAFCNIMHFELFIDDQEYANALEDFCLGDDADTDRLSHGTYDEPEF